jgi:outer membrane receptor for ferrienterochelin and colicins
VYHHFNRVEIDGRNDRPLVANDNRRVHYYGTRADYSSAVGRHFIKVGGEAYLAKVRDDFTIFPTQPGVPFAPFRSAAPVLGKEQSAYVQDQVSVTDHLMLDLGLRLDAFQGKRSDVLVGPRLGVSYKIADTPVALFASFGRLFLPPAVEFFDIAASAQGPGTGRFSDDFTFLPVRPEIDTQYEVGVKFPLHGFKTKVTQWYKHQKNFLDHMQLEHPSGDVNIFLPVNLERARSRGVEMFVESPRYKGLNFYVNYALYYAQAKGGITGGLIKRGEPPEPRYFFLDHDQRHTLSVGAEYHIERYQAWINANFRVGSGFPDASGTFVRSRLPGHAIVDLAIGKTFFQRWEAKLELENLTNNVYPINLSSEFNGSHYSAPRLVTFRLGYRF